MDKEITNINGQTGGNIPDGLPIPSRYWAILAIGLGVTVSVLDGAIANVALPTIAGDLHTSPSASIWVVNAYQLAGLMAWRAAITWGRDKSLHE